MSAVTHAFPPLSACLTYIRYLSPYYYTDLNGTKLEFENTGKSGYEGAPSLVAQANVFIHASGYVWNDKASPSLECTWGRSDSVRE